MRNDVSIVTIITIVIIIIMHLNKSLPNPELFDF